MAEDNFLLLAEDIFHGRGLIFHFFPISSNIEYTSSIPFSRKLLYYRYGKNDRICKSKGWCR